MLAVERQEKILKELARERLVRVSDLSAALGVTEKTVREDLEKLEEMGLLRRIRGGAKAVSAGDEPFYPPAASGAKFLAEKRDIAARAAATIRGDEVVALDSGSTTLEIAKVLPNEPLTVVTNDLFIIAELARKDRIRLVVPGGYRERNLLVGEGAAEFVRGLNIHKAFLSATGIHPEFGLTVFTGAHLPMKRALVETAAQVFCAADRSKFGRGALFTFASLEEVDAIYTDAGLPAETAELLRARGVKVDAGAPPAADQVRKTEESQ